ncbi:MAG: alpha/beta fold hydrolase [Myxococcales bacterium]|nr:alpha/beta fold hydrolase [Myxococcales bacterium]
MSSLIRVGELALHVEQPASSTTRAPILLLHGIFAAAWVFEFAQRWFSARGYASYALDLRGRGASTPVADVGRVPAVAYVEDALAAAQAVSQRHGVAPILIGHSMGGLLAQKVAERGLARALVLLCSAPPRGIPVLGRVLLSKMIMPRYLVPLLLSRPLMPTRADADAMILNAVLPDDRAAIFTKLAPDSGRAARELAFGGVRVDAGHVRCPVLSIVGLEDRFVPPRAGRAIAKRYGATIIERPEQAHFPFGEPGRDELLAAIERWLASSAGGGT